MAGFLDCVNTEPSSLKRKSYKLKFSTGVASPVFTGKEGRRGIKASGGHEYIEVELVDSETDQPIADEPAASKTVRVVLLPENFSSAVWTRSEFETSIITEHENKKNILQGDLFVNLKNGRGTIGNTWIKHDKKHLRKVNFRLGAMMDAYSYEIKEAVTGSFQVMDYRNLLTSKNRSVTSKDKVSKLKNIGKNIRKRLEDENIKTVADFLERFYSNSSGLEEIYGRKGKKFEETVRHAKTSISDKNCNACGSSSHRRGSVLLVEHDGSTEVDVKSYETSPSSNNTMSMTFDQDPLNQDGEQYAELSFLDLLELEPFDMDQLLNRTLV